MTTSGQTESSMGVVVVVSVKDSRGRRRIRSIVFMIVGAVLLLAALVWAVMYRSARPGDLITPPPVVNMPTVQTTPSGVVSETGARPGKDFDVPAGKRLVRFLVNDRPDFDRAMVACQAVGEYTDLECVESVSDGEF